MKTINDIYRKSMTDPVVKRYLEHVERNEMSLEEALIGMVFTFMEQHDQAANNYVRHLGKCPTPYIERQ